MPDIDPEHSSSDADDRRNDGPRVTMCITELDPGGAEKALVRVALGLRQLGWRVNVVSLRNAGELAALLEADGIQVTALECGGFADFRAIFRLRRFLQAEPPDVLLCFLHQANIVGRLAGWLAGVPIVVSGIRVADRRSLVVWTDRWTRRLSRHYVAVSRHVADVHARLCRISSARMSVIRNGVDLPTEERPPGPGNDESLRLLFVGRLTPQKRPQDLIDAVGRLPFRAVERIHVDIVGDGALRTSLQKLIEDRRLVDRIQLHGYQENVSEWMMQSDVLVLTSEWEGLPNVVLEAMACSLPVIATEVDGVREVVDDGVTGWLVPPRNVEALSDCIRRVCLDPARRSTVARRAFEAVQQQFCWDEAIQAYDQLLRRLLADESGLEKNR